MSLRVTDDEYRTLVARTGKAASVTTSQPVAKRNKYGAKKKGVDGYTFDSTAEAKRYMELKKLEAAGEVEYLILQPQFPINVGGEHVCTYVADFQYKENGRWVAEDVKGFPTPVYKLKKKLAEAYHKIEIREVKAKR